jgi:hypothetical protein
VVERHPLLSRRLRQVRQRQVSRIHEDQNEFAILEVKCFGLESRPGRNLNST